MTFPSQTQASVEKCCSYSCEEGDPDLWEQTDSGLPEPVLVCGPLASESSHTGCSRGQAVCSRGQGVQSPWGASGQAAPVHWLTCQQVRLQLWGARRTVWPDADRSCIHSGLVLLVNRS